MPLYDFACECGEITEARQGVDVMSIPCPACGKDAKRQAIYRVRSKVVRNPRYPDNICPGDIKDKHGRYRTKLWQESMAEATRRKERGHS